MMRFVNRLVPVAVLMALPAAAVGSTGNGNGNPITAFVAPTLLDAAQAYPSGTFDVIVQGSQGKKSADVGADVASESPGNPAPKAFRSIAGVEAQVTGKELLKLARKPGILAITPNAPVRVSTVGLSNQIWPVSPVSTSFPSSSSTWTMPMTGRPTVPGCASQSPGPTVQNPLPSLPA